MRPESRLGQLSFRRLTKVNATCVIRLPPMGYVYVGKQPVAWEDCCVEYWCEKTRKCMSRWTGRRDITEKLLKTTLNPNQSINNEAIWKAIIIKETYNYETINSPITKKPNFRIIWYLKNKNKMLGFYTFDILQPLRYRKLTAITWTFCQSVL